MHQLFKNIKGLFSVPALHSKIAELQLEVQGLERSLDTARSHHAIDLMSVATPMPVDVVDRALRLLAEEYLTILRPEMYKVFREAANCIREQSSESSVMVAQQVNYPVYAVRMKVPSCGAQILLHHVNF